MLRTTPRTEPPVTDSTDLTAGSTPEPVVDTSTVDYASSLVDSAATSTDYATSATDWSEWNADIADGNAQSAASYADAAATEISQYGHTEYADYLLNNAEMYSGEAAEAYSTAADYSATADSYNTAATTDLSLAETAIDDAGGADYSSAE
jgi:hypothetical protein